jgi:Predicted transcriptional regulator with C-terminal CBS domains
VASGSAAYAICLLARREAGLSQRALAAVTGVSPSTIARIEKGRMEPTVALLTRIVEACGLELRLSLASPVQPAPEPLGVEERLRENDRLAVLHRIGRRHRGE